MRWRQYLCRRNRFGFARSISYHTLVGHLPFVFAPPDSANTANLAVSAESGGATSPFVGQIVLTATTAVKTVLHM